MINVLAGAAIGALINTGAYVSIQLWRGRPVEWKPLAAACVGGIVAGSLAGTTLGASLLAGTTTSATEFLAIDGALSSGAEKMTANALDHKALGDGVPAAAGWGAVTAPAAGVFLRGVGAEVSKLVADAQTAAAAGAATTDATVAVEVADAATTAAAAVVPPPTTFVGRLSQVPTEAARTAAEQAPTPSAHVLGNVIANAAFGSPWVGEGVTVAQDAQNAAPVDPNASGSNAIPPALSGTPPTENAARTARLIADTPSTAVLPATVGIAGALDQLTPRE